MIRTHGRRVVTLGFVLQSKAFQKHMGRAFSPASQKLAADQSATPSMGHNRLRNELGVIVEGGAQDLCQASAQEDSKQLEWMNTVRLFGTQHISSGRKSLRSAKLSQESKRSKNSVDASDKLTTERQVMPKINEQVRASPQNECDRTAN